MISGFTFFVCIMNKGNFLDYLIDSRGVCISPHLSDENLSFDLK